MAKILLVEDDNNLREIFQMRLQAEGFQTLTASNGEEALVAAMKDKPDLIIADVMMPKMSGFEMLETLRATPEVAKIKVIMMTALGQAEDQVRGAKLGVVKYLVKSQVTLEDFARVVREVLAPGPGAPNAPAAAASTSTEASENNNKVESEKSMDPTPTNPSPVTPPSDGANPISSSSPASDSQQTEAQEQSTVQSQINDFAAATPPAGGPAPTPATDVPSVPSMGDSPAEHDDVPVTPPPASDPAVPPATDPASPPPPADGSGTPA